MTFDVKKYPGYTEMLFRNRKPTLTRKKSLETFYTGDNKQVYCRVAEPTCGSGAMVLGLVKCLQNRGYEKLGGKLYIEATDIDELCVCMTYTQLSLLGLSVRVIHGNSLSGEIFSTWDSPNLQIANLAGYFN